jgi:hypothetical protein
MEISQGDPDTDAVRAKLWAWPADHFTSRWWSRPSARHKGSLEVLPRLEPDAQGEFRSKCLGSDVIVVLHGEVGDVPPGHTTWDCYWASRSTAARLARPDSSGEPAHPWWHPAPARRSAAIRL